MMALISTHYCVFYEEHFLQIHNTIGCVSPTVWPVLSGKKKRSFCRAVYKLIRHRIISLSYKFGFADKSCGRVWFRIAEHSWGFGRSSKQISPLIRVNRAESSKLPSNPSQWAVACGSGSRGPPASSPSRHVVVVPFPPFPVDNHEQR
jgi:hypothetical protein